MAASNAGLKTATVFVLALFIGQLLMAAPVAVADPYDWCASYSGDALTKYARLVREVINGSHWRE
ncbi:hypothetical protein EJB05_04807 [Eragrostis curvula]|uniref:Pectate lyase N-terminal domain-containing protein n=1 Tax=Eragrostis curvula TaxID=38414 RepID=A0A5J9WBE7_9POAL|nr:hypothetical protein EJB05_04807 [Eragrostis curvula]